MKNVRPCSQTQCPYCPGSSGTEWACSSSTFMESTAAETDKAHLTRGASPRGDRGWGDHCWSNILSFRCLGFHMELSSHDLTRFFHLPGSSPGTQQSIVAPTCFPHLSPLPSSSLSPCPLPVGFWWWIHFLRVLLIDNSFPWPPRAFQMLLDSQLLSALSQNGQ